MKPLHVNMFFTKEMIENRKLVELLDEGWELISMAPYKMAPGEGGTYVQEYLITLRQPGVSADEAARPKHVGRVSDFK